MLEQQFPIRMNIRLSVMLLLQHLILDTFFTVDGNDNPYVNINIAAGGAGDVRAKLATEYSSIDLLSDVDTNNCSTYK